VVNLDFNRDFSTCIFDFDGVIVDSEPLHAEAKRATLDHFGVSYPARLFSDFKGRPDTDFFGFVADRLAAGIATAEEMGAYKREAYLRLFEAVPLVTGVQAFLAAARARFDKVGLATSATRRDLGLAVRKYQLDRWFDVIVTGDDTLRHKPDPEPYLRALAALGVTPGATLIVEDTPNGIRAAKSAGCTTAALTTAFAADELRAAGADLVVASFAELGQELDLVIPNIES
jgi:beta-phosphoglucomutase